MAIGRTFDFITQHPLTRRRPLPALLRFAAWQVRSRLSRDVTIDWIGGTRVIACSGMTGFTGNIYCGLHEFSDMGFLLHLLRSGDRFLDIGANVGSYTLLASGVCEAISLAFEPDPDTAFFLRRNVEVNGLGDRVVVHVMALGDTTGHADFTVGRDTMNQVVSAGDGSTRRVTIGRLDDIPDARGAVLMKIDVEGFEEHVLAGAERVLADGALLAVQSEGQSEVVLDTLKRQGFERAYYDPIFRALESTSVGAGSANGLFVRDWAAVRDRLSRAPRRDIFGSSI